MLVQMSVETFEALESQSRMQFRFGENPVKYLDCWNTQGADLYCVGYYYWGRFLSPQTGSRNHSSRALSQNIIGDEAQRAVETLSECEREAHGGA